MDALRTEAFSLLKPFCVTLTKDHTRENIAKLFTALQSVDILFLQDLQEYVIFPLRIILKHPKKCSQDLYLDLYTCMEYVLGHTKVTRWDLFQDIFHNATAMLSCPTDQSKVATLSEELKIAIIQTLRTLVKNSESSVVQHLYTILCLPLLGHSVSLLLNIAEVERARNLRILAMECLLDFSQADSKLSQCMKADIGNLYASFLPGISVTLCKIITGDTKQGFAVTSKAVYVWMRIVSLVMDDKLLEVYRQKQGSKSKDQKDLDERLAGLVVTRDENWVKTTSGNLFILVKQVATVRSHCNWRVRLGLVECAEHLLLHCSHSMKDSVPAFLEILVSLIGDDFTKVASGSRHALELFSQSQAVDQQHHLTEILEENLHKLATSLPRQIQTAEEEDKISLLNMLAGYISILGSRVKNFLLSLPHLKRLSLALLQILELECSDIKIVEERTTVTGLGSGGITNEACSIIRPRKYFKHFSNDRIFQKVQGVCHLLGYYGDIHLLIDHFLDIFHESSMFKLQATLVINEIMLGTTGELVCTSNTKNGKSWNKHSRDEIDSVIRMLIEEYLNPVNFDLVTSVTGSQPKVQSLEQQLRGLALVLKSSYERLLIHVLYPMLEKLGDDTAYISNAAFISLWDVCTACRYKSLDELIRNNCDYLMNAISLRLRHLNRNRKCPLVLKVMLQYSSAELLPLIDDTINEILESLDDHYAEESVLFMSVLNELSKAVVRWFPADDSNKTGKQSCTCGNQPHCQCHSRTNSTNLLDNATGVTEKQTSDENLVTSAGQKCCNSDCGAKKCVSFKCQNSGTENMGISGKLTCKCHCSCQLNDTVNSTNNCSHKLNDMNKGGNQCIEGAHSLTSGNDPDRIGRKTEELKSYFSNLLRLEREARGEFTEEELLDFSNDPTNMDEDVAMETEEEKKQPLPHHVKAVKEVMLRCKHIVSSRNPRLRLLVLDTITHTCTALKPYQEELLPLIHQIWPSFNACFADEEKLVTVKALDVLQVIARSAGDFVKHRITKDVLPKLSTFLSNQALISIHAGSAYQFTVNYKLQLAVLRNISSIAKLTCIEGSDLDLITTSCMPYLHTKQPATLQNACIDCCKELTEVDADLVWLKLCSVYCPKSYIPPSDQFTEIKRLKQASSSNAYTVNVTKIMTDCGLV
ncbi:TELO2-interacting protein 1 homolog [Ruditapes philippinarum]|uniref:TELO2-interacting protein 1 homolog n=1 Tax=Ruditapes philippinarum TaxID=129788 RepID=UPI00295B2DAF|nr:TELO2-interacting protein 1 homolog [Ruditapes philippinarum]